MISLPMPRFDGTVACRSYSLQDLNHASASQLPIAVGQQGVGKKRLFRFDEQRKLTYGHRGTGLSEHTLHLDLHCLYRAFVPGRLLSSCETAVAGGHVLRTPQPPLLTPPQQIAPARERFDCKHARGGSNVLDDSENLVQPCHPIFHVVGHVISVLWSVPSASVIAQPDSSLNSSPL